MIKKLALALIALMFIGGIGLYFLSSNLDVIIKHTIENYGAQATRTQTTLSNVDISLREGKVSLQGFKLANPVGFSTESAMKFAIVSVQIDPSKLSQDGPIMIKEIIIDAPELTYEVQKDGKSNLQTIQENIKTFARSLSPNKGMSDKPGAEVTNNKPKERKIIVDRILITNGQLTLSHELLAGKDIAKAKLPTIEMTNLGKDSLGVSGAELAEMILQKVTSTAIEAGQSSLIGQLRDQGIESLKGAVEQSEIGKAIGGFLGK